MKFFVKHMISTPCKMFVKEELTKLGIAYNSVELGEVEVDQKLSLFQRELLSDSLKKYGLEVVDDRRTILVEKIKAVITELVYYSDERPNIKISYILSEKLNLNYNYLAKVFSEYQGITIEKYIILQKIEHIKELMMYGELNMTQIANKLNYSSVAHLSLQFKKNTGYTPSTYRQLNGNRRRTIEEIAMCNN
jgi:YesN/AraC family two-component response regulator